MKLAIVLGTRPEIIRLSSTIKRCKLMFDTVIIHTGQNYDRQLYDVFLEDLELDSPDYYLDCSRESPGQAVGDVIAKTYTLFREIKPDAILILGDTNSCMCAYSAKRLKIPIFHAEAGNRCFDMNLPEEVNRTIIDHISEVNICYMHHAKENLIREGISSRFLFTLGSPMTEVIHSIGHKIAASSILDDMGLDTGDYFVVSFHREENVNLDDNLDRIVNSINNLCSLGKRVILSTHPRTRKILKHRNIELNSTITVCEPFGFIDYCALQQGAACVISDSGTLTEESSILRFPAVLLRTSTEHPEGIEAGNIIVGNIDWDTLEPCIRYAMNKTERNDVLEYQHVDFSDKVCALIASYTSIVNKFYWLKRG